MRTKWPRGITVGETPDGGVDAGLALLSVTPRPSGELWTLEEIAYVCGCSRQHIQNIQRRALRKIRLELARRNINEQNIF